MNSITVVCEDLDIGIPHSLVVSRTDAEALVDLDGTRQATILIPSINGHIEVHSDGVLFIFSTSARGTSHWTVTFEEFMLALNEALRV